MEIRDKIGFLSHLFVGLMVTAAGFSAEQPSDWRAACEQLRSYALTNVTAGSTFVLESYLFQATPEQRGEVEAVFLKMLEDPSASDDARHFICRQAAYMTSDEAVMALLALQAETNFCFSACYGLMQIPNPKARSALNGALDQRKGQTLICALQALAPFRDPGNLPHLVKLLERGSDRNVVCAAVTALGLIGGKETESVLKGIHTTDAGLSAVIADARFKCAEGLDRKDAAAVYTDYVKSSSGALRAAAFAGLLKAEPEQKIRRLLEAMKGSDASLKDVALYETRRSREHTLTPLLCELISALPASEQAVLCDVLRERGDPSALPALLKLAETGEEDVRSESIKAIGALGSVPQVFFLVKTAAQESGMIRACARDALVQMKDVMVERELVRLVPAADLAERREIVDALAERVSEAAVPTLMVLAEDPDAVLRKAALQGLVRSAGMPEYEEVVTRMLSVKDEGERRAYQSAAMRIFRRVREPEKCIGVLLRIAETMAPQLNEKMYELLGSTGAPEALRILMKGLQSADVGVQKTVLRAVSSWPDAKPVVELMAFVRQSADATAKILALRACVTLVQRDTVLLPAEKAGVLSEMHKLAERDEERNLIAGAMGAVK